MLHNLTHHLPRLIVKLLLGLAKDRFEDGGEAGRELLNCGVRRVICRQLLAYIRNKRNHATGINQHTELEDALVDRRVLLEVLLQGQHVDHLREQLSDDRRLGVPHNHAREAPSHVVLHTRVRDRKSRLELANDLLVQAEHVGIARADDELANGKGSVGLGENVVVREAVKEDLGKGLGEGGHRRVEVADDFGGGTDGRRPLLVLLGAGVLDDRLLEDVPVLGEVGAQGRGHANDNIHCRVDHEPVELRRAVLSIVLLLITKVLLAGVGTSNHRGKGRDHLRLEVVNAQDRGAASLQRLRRILVDGRDDTTVKS